MDYSRMMALFVAGSLVCGGFAAFAADNAKPAETKPADNVKPAETKPAEDPFSVIPPVLAEIGDQKITKDMVVSQLVGSLPNGQLPPGVSADLVKRMLPNLAKGVVLQ